MNRKNPYAYNYYKVMRLRMCVCVHAHIHSFPQEPHPSLTDEHSLICYYHLKPSYYFTLGAVALECLGNCLTWVYLHAIMQIVIAESFLVSQPHFTCFPQTLVLLRMPCSWSHTESPLSGYRMHVFLFHVIY